MKRLARIVGSFAIVVLSYCVYARTAVPMIEPSAKRAAGSTATAEDIQQAASAVDNQRAVLKRWFSANDWELTSPKILGTPQGMLILKTYHPLPESGNKKVRIEPCTMIFLPKGQTANEEERSRRAIILRAPLGIMEFDQPFDLRRGDIGKLNLVGGELIGDVLIRSDQRSPGPEDDLRIVTRNVTLSNERVTTPHPISFDYGPNHGEGRDMVIELPSEAEKSAQPRGSLAASIKSFHLTQDVKMRLRTGDSGLLPGGGPRPKPRAADGPTRADGDERPKAPVLITCQGPFHLDAAAQVATFKKQVVVVQINFEKDSDQMTCDQLAIEFETAPAEAAVAVPTQPAAPPGEAGASDSPKMRISWVKADGSPVNITARSSGFRARGRRLEYDVNKGTGDLIDTDDVMLRQELPSETREMHAPKIHFERDPNDPKGRLSVFLAEGEGWLKTRPLKGAPTPKDGRVGGSEPLDVTWKKSLHFRPHQEFQVISVNGKAHVATAASGSLDADNIDVFLVEAPAAPAVAGESAPAMELSPRMLHALGHVRIESEQVTGVVGDLQMWFEPKAPPAPAAAPADGAPPPPPPPPAEPKPKVAKRQRFHVSGDVLQANVRLEGGQPQVTKLNLNGHVRCKETQTEKLGEKPMVILGDRLTLDQPLPEQSVVSVTGQPSQVDARGLTLLGGSTRRPGTIHYHRGENHLWVKGPGTLTLPGNRDLEGRPTGKNQPIEIDWQGGMDYDGDHAVFSGDVENDVVARQEHSWLRTPSLEVKFAKTVRFDSANTGEQAKIDQIICDGGVRLENRGFDEETGRELASVNKLHALDLTLYYASGDFVARGPGTVESVRVDTGESNAFLLGGAADEDERKQVKDEKDDEEEGFNFLLVHFQRELNGNLRHQVMNFYRSVRAVYGPVHDWQERLSVDDPEELEVGGFVLRSETLQIAKQSVIAKDKQAFELTATGNAVVEGVPVLEEMFLASASLLTYDMSKGLLVLDGQGRDARLYSQKRPGAAQDRIFAKKIYYYPATQKFSVEGFHSGNINKLPEGNKQKKKSS